MGEGKGGEVNKLSGDGLDVGEQLKLICQFCHNPHLKHLRVNSRGYYWRPLDIMDHARLIWTTLMIELQGSTSLEYIEFWDFPYFDEDDKLWMKAMVEMLSTNSSLLGLKILISNVAIMNVIPFMETPFWEVVLTSKTLQLLYLTFPPMADSSIESLKVIVASLTPNSTGYQSSTRLRALFMNSYARYSDYFNTIMILKPLIKAFINMLETNKTLTTIQIPNFVVLAKDIVKVLCGLEVNQSISNIILGPGDDEIPYIWVQIRYQEFSREEVFSRLLKLIKF